MPVKKWNEEMALRAYEMARAGLSQKDISAALGITYDTYQKWKTKRPLFKKALAAGRKVYTTSQNNQMSFMDYVYTQLPPKLKRTWDVINHLESAPGGIQKIEAMLERQGLYARQYLFFHAWIESNFSLSTALRKVNISKLTFQRWVKQDPDFAALAQDVEWYRKNFFEDHLMMLVKGGDVSATIFVNKTLNRDRGYGDIKTINTKVEGEIQHKVLPLNMKELPLNVQRDLLKHLRQTKQVESVVLEETNAGS